MSDLNYEEKHEELTVKSIVLDMYELTQATDMKWKETGEPLSVVDLQDWMYLGIEQLADLLGIDLRERE